MVIIFSYFSFFSLFPSLNDSYAREMEPMEFFFKHTLVGISFCLCRLTARK